MFFIRVTVTPRQSSILHWILRTESVSRRINNSRQFRVTARRNEDRRIPVVFDRNLLAARSRATDDTSRCFIAVREILSGERVW